MNGASDQLFALFCFKLTLQLVPLSILSYEELCGGTLEQTGEIKEPGFVQMPTTSPITIVLSVIQALPRLKHRLPLRNY